jgi:hypothetical protein
MKHLSFVNQLKSQQIVEEISDPTQITLKLIYMHCNMVADETRLNTNKKDTKIVALTSALQEVKKKLGIWPKRCCSTRTSQKAHGRRAGTSIMAAVNVKPRLAAPSGRS